MENTIEDLKTQLNDSKRYLLQLQNGNERQHDLETQATTTNFSAAALGHDIEALTTNLNDSKRHVTQLQDDNERLASLTAAMKHDAESLRTQLNESKRNVVQLQKDNEQLQNQASAIIALERDTDKLNKQLNESKRHVAQLQNDNKQLQQKASEATTMKRRLNDAKAQWENESETRATATAALEHEVKGLTRTAQVHDLERRVAGLLDGVFHNHRLQQESRTVREATPVTPAPFKLSASYPSGSQSVSNGPSVSKLKRKRSFSEEDDSSRQSVESDGHHMIAPELPATLMWRFHQEGLELSPDTILKNVRDCSRVISSPLSIPVPFDFISCLNVPFLALLDLRLGGYVPAGPGQPGLVLVFGEKVNTEACQIFVPVRDQPEKLFYCGIYNCKVIRKLSVKELNDQGLLFQVKRAELVLELWRDKLAQVSVRKSDVIMTRATSQLAVGNLTVEDVVEALAKGEEKLYLARLKCIGFDYALDQRIGDEVSRMTQDEAKVPGLSSPSSTNSEAQPEHDHPERLRG